jgi:hypothetical protein
VGRAVNQPDGFSEQSARPNAESDSYVERGSVNARLTADMLLESMPRFPPTILAKSSPPGSGLKNTSDGTIVTSA